MLCRYCNTHCATDAHFCKTCGASLQHAAYSQVLPALGQQGPSPARGNKAILFFLLYFVGFQFVFAFVIGFLGLNLSPLLSIVLVQVVGLFVPFICYLQFTKQSIDQVLPWKGLGAKNALMVVIISLAILPAVHMLARLASFVFVTVEVPITEPMWLVVAVIAVLPSLFEEFLFRGMMYTEYHAGGVSIHKIALISGIFFGLMHLNFYQAIYTTLLGVLYAYMVHYTRSILAPMLAHFVNNGIAVVLGYQGWYASLWGNVPMFLLVIGVAMIVMTPVVLLCLNQMKKHHERTQEPSPAPTFDNTTMPQHKPQANVFTWAFWVALIVFFVITLNSEITLRMLF